MAEPAAINGQAQNGTEVSHDEVSNEELQDSADLSDSNTSRKRGQGKAKARPGAARGLWNKVKGGQGQRAVAVKEDTPTYQAEPTSRQQTTLGDEFATNRNLEMAWESGPGQVAEPLAGVAPGTEYDPNQMALFGSERPPGPPDAGAVADPITPGVDTSAPEPAARVLDTATNAPRRANRQRKKAAPTAAPDIQTIPINRISVRPDLFQARDVAPGQAVDPKRVQQIIENWNPERFDPISVVSDGEGGYIVFGGHHRLDAVAQMGHIEIPARITQGDINDPEDRNRLVQEAVVSNFNVAESNLRERATAARRLADSGWDNQEIAGNMRLKSKTEADRLLYLYDTGPVILDRITLQPELAPAGIELGRAMKEKGLSQEAAQGLFSRWVKDYEETDRVPGHRSLRRQIDLLSGVAAEGPAQAGMLEGFAGDVHVTEFDQRRRELTELTEEANRNRSRLTSCEALAAELGVDIGRLKRAAQTREDYLTAAQEAKAREVFGLPELPQTRRSGSSRARTMLTPSKPQAPQAQDARKAKNPKEPASRQGKKTPAQGKAAVRSQPKATKTPRALTEKTGQHFAALDNTKRKSEECFAALETQRIKGKSGQRQVAEESSNVQYAALEHNRPPPSADIVSEPGKQGDLTYAALDLAQPKKQKKPDIPNVQPKNTTRTYAAIDALNCDVPCAAVEEGKVSAESDTEEVVANQRRRGRRRRGDELHDGGATSVKIRM